MNTYGFYPFSKKAYNTLRGESLHYPEEARDVLVTSLQLVSLVLRALSYHKKTQNLVGYLRIAQGTATVLVTTVFGERNAKMGMIIQRWWDEAMQHGFSLIFRGFLDLSPAGRAVNGLLDVACTFSNVITSFAWDAHRSDYAGAEDTDPAHSQPPIATTLGTIELGLAIVRRITLNTASLSGTFSNFIKKLEHLQTYVA